MKKILIVEDDKFLQKIYYYKLKKEGFNVLQAKDGEEGLKKIMHDKPDLVLLDMVMPKINGFDVLEAVRKSDEMKKTKVVILSNLSQEMDVAKGKKLGALDYIVKSNIGIEELVVKIKKIMRN